MKKTKLNKKVIFGVVLACLMVGVVAGTILVQKQVGMKVNIIEIDVQFFDVDGTTPLIFVDWGDVKRGLTVKMPLTHPTDSYFLKNTGDVDCYIYWSCNLDSSFGTLFIRTADGMLTDGTFLTAGTQLTGIYFTLNVPSTAPRGTVDFELTIYGCDEAGK